MNLTQIISGGQTGVDRGALDAALAAQFSCGGYCPKGRKAEDGVIDARYPLTELPTNGYRQRTIRNLSESDGTLILYHGYLSGGTQETMVQCIRLHKPYKLIDAQAVSVQYASELALAFITDFGIAVLNVAGPRLSQWSDGYQYSLEVITNLIDFSNLLKLSGETHVNLATL